MPGGVILLLASYIAEFYYRGVLSCCMVYCIFSVYFSVLHYFSVTDWKKLFLWAIFFIYSISHQDFQYIPFWNRYNLIQSFVLLCLEPFLTLYNSPIPLPWSLQWPLAQVLFHSNILVPLESSVLPTSLSDK